ncbi:MAG TPA: methyltransferase domain-containing protein [Acidimicrobiales bacterium]|nr:methyltransferase domain-containing protein [Acidimicrobiales bacterium]
MAAGSASTWDPAQYNRFAVEREQPFWDLAAVLEPVTAPAVADMGCGDGRLTAALHDRLGAQRTVGVDASPDMLASASSRQTNGLDFERGDLAQWQGHGLDIVFSNAALHWVPDHAAVLRRWREALRPSGQLAVQVPANASHPSHQVASELAEEWLGRDAPPDPVNANVRQPEDYAELLEALGFARQHVRLQVYTHRLASTAEVIEWLKGTSLTRIAVVLTPEDYRAFVDEYRRRLVEVLGDRSPYLYLFKRILLWGRLP